MGGEIVRRRTVKQLEERVALLERESDAYAGSILRMKVGMVEMETRLRAECIVQTRDDTVKLLALYESERERHRDGSG